MDNICCPACNVVLEEVEVLDLRSTKGMWYISRVESKNASLSMFQLTGNESLTIHGPLYGPFSVAVGAALMTKIQNGADEKILKEYEL